MTQPPPGHDLIKFRIDAHLWHLFGIEATWRGCHRNTLIAALITTWLNGTPPPPPSNPPHHNLMCGQTIHTGTTLPAGLWDTYRTACRTTGTTAPKMLTGQIRALLGEATAHTPDTPPAPAATDTHH